MHRMKPIEEQVIVVTGASSGIGLATARLAASRGADVILAARSGRALEEITDEIRERGGRADFVVADVSVREQVERIADRAVNLFGGIDTWVNDAGIAIYGRLDEVHEADSRRLFETNFWGVVNGSLVALPYLRMTRGALINVGSEVSEAVAPLLGMYTASKHAVKGFTDALRIEIEEIDESPVAITLIQPTATDTPFPQHARNYQAFEPKLPDPQIDPYRVAEAILDAATHHRRDVKVGAMAHVETWMSKLAPRLGDRLAAHNADRQQYEEPPRRPQGSLFDPSEDPHVYGSGGRLEDGRERSPRRETYGRR